MGYSKDIYEEANEILSRKRMKAEQECRRRKNMMYKLCPRLAEIEHEMASTAANTVRSVFGGADSKEMIELLKKQNLALQAERTAILKSAQLPSDYLKPQYECRSCNDEGYIDGRICDCMRKLLRQVCYDRLNRTSPLALSDFDTFSLKYYSDTLAVENTSYTQREYMERILNYCMKYAYNFTQNSESLLFQGSPGLGKTHLSLAIAKEVINRGLGVVYVSVPAMVSKLELQRFRRKKSDEEENEDWMNALTNCDLLIMDDLGTEFATPYSTAEIFNIINMRILLSHPTIISTNLTLTELQEVYSNRTISRIIGGVKRFRFVGNDVRQQKTTWNRTNHSENK